MGITRGMAGALLCAAALSGVAQADEASWSRLMDQARAASERQDFVSAEKSLREAHADAFQTYGEDSLQLARTRLALSRALIELTRLYEAMSPARGAYDKFSRALGPESADTLRAKKNLAYVVANTEENPVEGERLYTELIETWTRLAGPNSPEVIENLNYLGNAQAKQRRWYDAEATLAKALAGARETYGPASAAVARARLDLGSVIERQGRRGRLAEAASNYRASLDITRQLYGEKDPRVVDSLDYLAQVTYRIGNTQEGIGMAREAVEIRTEKLGSTNFRTAESNAKLARLLAASGKYEEAQALFRSSLETLAAFYGQRHILTQTVAANYAISLKRSGNADEARRVENLYGVIGVTR